MLVCLLLYAYCVGVFSRRQIAQACARHLAFLAIVGQDRPDCRPLSDFRKLHREAFGDVCVQVLRSAGASGLVQWGQVATDGSKRQGHAARHKAMRDGYLKKAVERWREEMEALVTPADQHDAEDDAAWGSRRGDEWPAELARRAARLATIEAAMRRWEARAKAEAEAERQRRAAAEAERQRTGTTRRGRAPKEVDERPADTAQRSCTDAELPSMQPHNKGWDDGGHAQVSGDGAPQLLLACDVTAETNDTQPALPMAQWTVAPLEQAGLERPQDATGATQQLPGPYESGSDSAAAAAAVELLGCDPSMAPGRQRHHAPEAEASEPPPTARERMAAKGRPPAGRALYARRTVIVEPVFGPSKEARSFRRFLLRGLANRRGEWRLVCVTHNLLQMWRHACAPITVEADEMVPMDQKGLVQDTSLK